MENMQSIARLETPGPAVSMVDGRLPSLLALTALFSGLLNPSYNVFTSGLGLEPFLVKTMWHLLETVPLLEMFPTSNHRSSMNSSMH